MDIREFFFALIADWVALMSGIASVILMALGVVRKWEQVPRWVLLTAAVICFVFASARIWTTEHRKYLAEFERNTPIFTVDVGGAVRFYESRKDVTIISLVIRIINGGADSAVINWRAHYKSPSIDRDVDCTQILNDPFTIEIQPGQNFVMRKSENIMNRAAVPIPRGGMVDGWLPLAVQGDHNLGSDTKITVTVSDYKGKKYTGIFQGGGKIPSWGTPMVSTR